MAGLLGLRQTCLVMDPSKPQFWSKREGRSSLFEIRVEEHHCDAYQHVNNAEYLKIFEMARWEHLRLFGKVQAEVVQSGLVPVILSLKLDFKREVKGGDLLSIRTTTQLRNRKIFEIHQEARVDENLSSVAQFTHGMMDLQMRRLVEIPSDWLSLLVSDPPA